MERNNEETEPLIEETVLDPSSSPTRPSSPARSAKSKVPEVEVHLYRSGKGPINVFKSPLGGWDQDRLEVQDILDKYGLKALYVFHPETGRGVPIRFSARNGRSFLSYSEGGIVMADGEPKDSLVMPVTKIIISVAMLSLLIAFLVKETPEMFKTFGFSKGKFPPWLLACVVIVFTRLRKRTKTMLEKKYGK